MIATLFLYWTFVHQLIGGVGGIQLLQVSIPSVIQAGEGAVLLCDVDMENEKLYSVKWYKENDLQSVEFYRFVPRERPPVIVYSVPGISVNKSLSDWQRVYLSRVSLASTGHYRCEVSAEGPSFSSVSGGGHMEVVVLPKSRPTIAGARNNYRAGDLVDVNCTSAASKPAANIRWFINDRKAPQNYLRQYKAFSGEDGLETTVLGLTFEVRDDHLKDQGRLMLRCVASVGPALGSHQQQSNGHHQQQQHNFYQHQRNNPAVPVASTVSFGSFEQQQQQQQQQQTPVDRLEPPEQASSNAVMETMEVRFIASQAGSLHHWTLQLNWLLIIVLVSLFRHFLPCHL